MYQLDVPIPQIHVHFKLVTTKNSNAFNSHHGWPNLHTTAFRELTKTVRVMRKVTFKENVALIGGLKSTGHTTVLASI